MPCSVLNHLLCNLFPSLLSAQGHSIVSGESVVNTPVFPFALRQTEFTPVEATVRHHASEVVALQHVGNDVMKLDVGVRQYFVNDGANLGYT